MFDYAPIRNKEVEIGELCGQLTVEELKTMANDMVDKILSLIEDCVDADVVFEPVDPEAHDAAAATEGEVDLAWSLGHLIVHVTASAEETATLAAELARGVRREGRSRYETPWQSVTTLAQCRERLAESRRILLASLGMWPTLPHLDNTIELRFLAGPINAPSRFCGGLSHAAGHLNQISEVIRQAKAARA